MSVCVVGSINVDLTAYGPGFPRPGETVFADGYTTTLGGKGANQAVAAARMGGPVRLIGRLGDDAFGDLARRWLRGYCVADDDVRGYADQGSGVAFIHVNQAGENCITVVSGANKIDDDHMIDRASAVLGATKVMLLQLEIPLAQSRAVARAARAAGVFTILDPAPAQALDEALLADIDAITPNEHECEILTGVAPRTPELAGKAAGILRARGVGLAVIKMGRRGVYAESADYRGFCPPFPVTAIDSVAAGDCFNGGLAASLAAGADIATAICTGAACGALATTRKGAAEAAPDAAAVAALLERYP